jgi:hypothetical protein
MLPVLIRTKKILLTLGVVIGVKECPPCPIGLRLTKHNVQFQDIPKEGTLTGLVVRLRKKAVEFEVLVRQVN